MTRKELIRMCLAVGGVKFLCRTLYRRYVMHTNIVQELRNYYPVMDAARYPLVVKEIYRIRTGKKLDLSHPRTFNDKMQWLKIYDSTPLKTRLADKCSARDWVAEKIGAEHLVPLLGVWEKFDDIDFDALPDQFVLKCNHGSGMNVIVRDKKQWLLPEDSGGGVEKAREKFGVWLKKNYGFSLFELQYKDIKPCIVAEKYIGSPEVNPADYKFHCFGGEVGYIQYITDRNIETHYAREVFYDKDWNVVPFISGVRPAGEKTERPAALDEMLREARVLCEGFAYVRVDLYDVDGKTYFGEMTFTPDSGYAPWSPADADLMLGEKIVLP